MACSTRDAPNAPGHHSLIACQERQRPAAAAWEIRPRPATRRRVRTPLDTACAASVQSAVRARTKHCAGPSAALYFRARTASKILLPQVVHPTSAHVWLQSLPLQGNPEPPPPLPCRRAYGSDYRPSRLVDWPVASSAVPLISFIQCQGRVPSRDILHSNSSHQLAVPHNSTSSHAKSPTRQGYAAHGAPEADPTQARSVARDQPLRPSIRPRRQVAQRALWRDLTSRTTDIIHAAAAPLGQRRGAEWHLLCLVHSRRSKLMRVCDTLAQHHRASSSAHLLILP